MPNSGHVVCPDNMHWCPRWHPRLLVVNPPVGDAHDEQAIEAGFLHS